MIYNLVPSWSVPPSRHDLHFKDSKTVSKGNVIEDPIRDMINDAFSMHEHHLEGGPYTPNEGSAKSTVWHQMWTKLNM